MLGLVDDMWYRWVGDVGITGPDKGEGGKYLLLPPGYKGDVPEVDGDPKPGVDLVKRFTKIYPLSQADNPPQVKFVNLSNVAFNTLAPADYSFWEYLNEVVQEENHARLLGVNRHPEGKAVRARGATSACGT